MSKSSPPLKNRISNLTSTIGPLWERVLEIKFNQMLALALGAITILAVFAACTGEAGETIQLPEGFYGIDPLFSGYYDKLGGKDTVGLGITPMFEADGTYYQYTVAALMGYDPEKPRTQRYFLAPLGRDLGVNEKAASPSNETDAMFIEGHNVHPVFVLKFQELGGEEVIGRPLTEVHYNPDKNRHEQYFENVGFYLPVGGSQEDVRLLAYGSWKCSDSCQSAQPVENAIISPALRVAPFTHFANRLGADFTGFALSEPYLSSERTLEQIFENVVMVSDLDVAEQISLRPIVEELEIPADPLEAASTEEGMNFFSVRDTEGYNIPNILMEYINQRGGFDVVGQPLTQYKPLHEDAFRQCFENACLEVQEQARGEFQVKPVPLGYTYRESFYPLPSPSGFQTSLEQVSLQVWASYPMVAPDQKQQIGVGVFSGNEPLPGVEPLMELTLPDGTQDTYHLAPTGLDGHTGVRLEPISGEAGTLIPYKVCVYTGDGNKFCVLDSFLIWETAYFSLTPTVPESTEMPASIFGQVRLYLPIVYKTIKSEVLEVESMVKTFLPMLFR